MVRRLVCVIQHPVKAVLVYVQKGCSLETKLPAMVRMVLTRALPYK